MCRGHLCVEIERGVAWVVVGRELVDELYCQRVLNLFSLNLCFVLEYS